MLKKFGYVRVGAAVNKLKIADIAYNVEEMISILDEAIKKGIEIITFPELSITGYTAQDLFLNDDLIQKTLIGLEQLKEYSKKHSIVFIVGAPLKIGNVLYNCAVSFSDGKIIGVTPKTYIPNYNEFYEARYFASADRLKVTQFSLLGEEVPVSNLLLYHAKNYVEICYAVDICEDLWASTSPSNMTCMAGATIIFNLSSSNELVGKCNYRKSLIKSQASKTISAYVYASSGISESTTDLVFSGHAMIAEPNGETKENDRFSFESNIIYQDVDVFRIAHDRLTRPTAEGIFKEGNFIHTSFCLAAKENSLSKVYSKTPFITQDKDALEEILNLQTYGLAKRVKHLGNAKMVIGISGGADSTLAFLVCLRVAKVLHMETKEVIAITMPGFGTSSRTYENAVKLIKTAQATFKEISIKDACIQHYKDIEHDPNVLDVTYENAQARERTQILFDYANKVGGIVIGTGDLSEIALGWDTYNGDHMSSYAVNVSIPKTLVTTLIAKIRDDQEEGVFKDTLSDILDTPISPELLPPDATGKIAQKSEASVGPYIIQDFFLYHFMRYGASVKKLYFLACQTFTYPHEEIKKYLTTFIKRFFTQQFKRNCMPDGVKVGTISLSPRGDLRMSSDTSYNLYLKELESL
ncbi:MAG: NAD(+) synthase [Anaeroplasmataceae bacterium]|nr:NAD(+) synthase [Anaeroplasmataceae bacterium]MDE6414687.1 NAD(+) synthase [Anaeroplasmataceae bacterium]